MDQHAFDKQIGFGNVSYAARWNGGIFVLEPITTEDGQEIELGVVCENDEELLIFAFSERVFLSMKELAGQENIPTDPFVVFDERIGVVWLKKLMVDEKGQMSYELVVSDHIDTNNHFDAVIDEARTLAYFLDVIQSDHGLEIFYGDRADTWEDALYALRAQLDEAEAKQADFLTRMNERYARSKPFIGSSDYLSTPEPSI